MLSSWKGLVKLGIQTLLCFSDFRSRFCSNWKLSSKINVVTAINLIKCIVVKVGRRKVCRWSLVVFYAFYSNFQSLNFQFFVQNPSFSSRLFVKEIHIFVVEVSEWNFTILCTFYSNLATFPLFLKKILFFFQNIGTLSKKTKVLFKYLLKDVKAREINGSDPTAVHTLLMPRAFLLRLLTTCTILIFFALRAKFASNQSQIKFKIVQVASKRNKNARGISQYDRHWGSNR